MLLKVIFLLLVATTLAEAGPIPNRNPRWLFPRHRHGESSTPNTSLRPPGASSTSLASNGSMVGIVLAVPNDPVNSPPLTAPIPSVAARPNNATARGTQRASAIPTSSKILRSSSVPGTSNATGTAVPGSSATGKMIGIVFAVPNDPGNSPPLTGIPSVSGAKMSSISALLASMNARPTGGLASNGSSQSILNSPFPLNASTTTAPDSSPTGKMIGIVPAVPNDPGNSPPLTSIPPVDPGKLSRISVALASIGSAGVPGSSATLTLSSSTSAQLFPTGSLVSAAPLASSTPLAVSTPLANPTPFAVSTGSVAVPAAASPATSTSISTFNGVQSTTFPLIGDPPPQPQPQSTQSPTPTATATPLAALTTFSIAVTGSPISSPVASITPAVVTTTVELTRTQTVLAAAASGQSSDSGGDSSPRSGKGKKSGHHHNTRKESLSATAGTAATLAIPSIFVTAPSNPATTLTIEVPSPAAGALSIVPINPDAANAVVSISTSTISAS